MDWSRLEEQLQDIKAGISAAELHGHLCGRAVGGHIVAGDGGRRLVYGLLNQEGQESSEDALSLSVEIAEESEQRLENTLFDFELLLPDDQAPLNTRLEAMADWANGLLEGLGHCLEAADLKRDPEVREILADLAEIGNMAMEAEDTEDNEAHYAELYEYLRVAVVNLYTIFRAAAQDEADEAEDELH